MLTPPTPELAAQRPNTKEAAIGRACLVSHRLGGISGVSMEAEKWASALRALGWTVTRAAGAFFDQQPGDVPLRGLWSDVPGDPPPPVDETTIERLISTHDLLILDNAGSLWTAPEAALALERQALAAGMPTIVRHHDPPWSGAPLRSVPADSLPLHNPRHVHVVINRITHGEFARRWPELESTGALQLIYNRVDPDALTGGDRDGTRAQLGVQPDEFLVVHPARAIAKRKNVPAAVEFVLALEQTIPKPVRLWITDGSTITPNLLAKYEHVRATQAAFDRIPNLIRGQVPKQADLYAASDLVILPSTWEGWGLPVIEAAMAGKPIMAGPYAVLNEIKDLGVTVYEPGELSQLAALLVDPDRTREVMDRNRHIAMKHFTMDSLREELKDALNRAAGLVFS